jgi:hypothetical protein
MAKTTQTKRIAYLQRTAQYARDSMGRLTLCLGAADPTSVAYWCSSRTFISRHYRMCIQELHTLRKQAHRG